MGMLENQNNEKILKKNKVEGLVIPETKTYKSYELEGEQGGVYGMVQREEREERNVIKLQS